MSALPTENNNSKQVAKKDIGGWQIFLRNQFWLLAIASSVGVLTIIIIVVVMSKGFEKKNSQVPKQWSDPIKDTIAEIYSSISLSEKLSAKKKYMEAFTTLFGAKFQINQLRTFLKQYFDNNQEFIEMEKSVNGKLANIKERIPQNIYQTFETLMATKSTDKQRVFVPKPLAPQ